MKSLSEKLVTRRRINRPKTTVTIKLPEDVSRIERDGSRAGRGQLSGAHPSLHQHGYAGGRVKTQQPDVLFLI